jgi:type 1 glutamine amidotransferase
MSLNMAKTKLKKPYHVPILWVKDYGEGKVMHMSLGHNEAVWTNEKYMESMLGGIQWMLNLEEGDATPNPELSAEQEKKAMADAGGAN